MKWNLSSVLRQEKDYSRTLKLKYLYSAHLSPAEKIPIPNIKIQ